MSKYKSYLGDGVYADAEHGMIKLTTENGIEATNEIFLEMPVYDKLRAWVTRTEEAIRAEQPPIKPPPQI